MSLHLLVRVKGRKVPAYWEAIYEFGGGIVCFLPHGHWDAGGVPIHDVYPDSDQYNGVPCLSSKSRDEVKAAVWTTDPWNNRMRLSDLKHRHYFIIEANLLDLMGEVPHRDRLMPRLMAWALV